jgi:hypothetical protein
VVVETVWFAHERVPQAPETLHVTTLLFSIIINGSTSYSSRRGTHIGPACRYFGLGQSFQTN